MTLSELEEEARKRKERLTQWKVTKQLQTTKRKEYEDEENETDQPTSQPAEAEEEQPVEFPKPIFRNYKPHDSAQLSGAIVLPKPKLIDVKSMIDEQLKNKPSGNNNSVSDVTEDVDLLSLAPRKPDWDLKRDVEKKMKRLEKRTARAIAELTRERLLTEQKQSQTSLAEVVATTSKLNEAIQDDED